MRKRDFSYDYLPSEIENPGHKTGGNLAAENSVFMSQESDLIEEKSGAIVENYDASKLSQLKGLEAVRKKPGMYIGGTDERALHHCVSEVLDNSVDEHLAGHCSKIEVTIHVDGSISIRDDGRGIPVDINQESGLPGVELVLATFSPSRALIRLLLPTLERPRKATSGAAGAGN